MTDFWGEKLYNSHFQKCKLWNQYPNMRLEQSNLICFLLNHGAHIFCEIRIPSFIFCISLLIYIQPQTTAFSSNSSQKPWAAISEKQNKTKTLIKTPRNTLIKALFEVWGRLSCEFWPLCSMLHNHFHLRFERIGWTRAFLSFILSSTDPHPQPPPQPPPPGNDGHMAGTLPGFSNNRRDPISIPTSCHQWLLGYFVLARLKMWFEFTIRTELNAMPFLPPEPSIS